ncbi:MAG: serine aminopeptidase domain-containing protein [Bryobacteraceae bacterium]
MSVLRKSALLVSALLFLLPAALLAGCEEGTQSSGARFLLCTPSGSWNGGLVLYAHGYVSVPEGGANPDAWKAQLTLPGGPSLPDLVTSYGFAFAASSYSKDGLAVLPGVADTMDLITVFRNRTGVTPRRVFVTGVSEGGLIAAKALEQYPQQLNGGLAACGPIGDFRKQIDYFGDARVLFDYFFPNALPPTAIDIPPPLMAGWPVKAAEIAQLLQANPLMTAQLLSTGKIPIGLNPANAGDAILSVLWYNVFATNDAKATLGGNPFDNRFRWYSGSLNDLLLNWRVARFSAAPAAVAEMTKYQTSGNLRRPIITLHTTWDPVVPAWQESAYAKKVAAAGKSHLLVRYPVPRYGHCTFNEGEVLIAFLTMVLHPYSF